MIKFVTQAFAVCCALGLPLLGNAQVVFPIENGKVLVGVRVVDAVVQVGAALNMANERESMQSRLQSTFELALRRDGLIVDRGAPNLLLCGLRFAEAGGLVAYSIDVSYYGFNANGVQPLLWATGGIGTVGRRSFSTESIAKDCSDMFAKEWFRWNPRR